MARRRILIERAFAALPALEQMLGPERFEREQRSGTEDDVPRDARFGAREAAGEVPRGNRLVHRVGLHVLVVESAHLRTEPEPSHRVAVAPVRDRRAHLEHREVPDERAAQAPV